MMYSKVNLDKTDYQILPNAKLLVDINIPQLNEIYVKYCKYKQFESVMPIFDSEYTDPHSDVIGYYDNGNLIAFSLVKRYDSHNAECIQFAWNYENPKLSMGLLSLQHECAYYKSMGFKNLYLGPADEYKLKIEGSELLGPTY